MSWFSSRGPGSRERPGRAKEAVQPPAAEPQVHRSLGLSTLLASFGGHSRVQVLDLGPAVGGNVEFLAQYGCKLYIQDLHAALAPDLALAAPDTAAATALSLGSAIAGDHAAVREARTTWEAREERGDAQGERHIAVRLGELLTFPEDTRFDAVLAWDLLNYLDRREVAALADQLNRYCRPGALLFALISILKQAPAQPVRFRILDHERLAYEVRGPALRPCPRYAPAELSELLRGFRLDRTFLMRHGVQEYLFAREPG
jgi:SAM-dependent methyltransferase